jgi:hypothetical protein
VLACIHTSTTISTAIVLLKKKLLWKLPVITKAFRNMALFTDMRRSEMFEIPTRVNNFKIQNSENCESKGSSEDELCSYSINLLV